MSNAGKVDYKIEVVDAVVKAELNLNIDIIEILKEMAEKSENKIDDKLVKLVELARDNADWEGYAKEHIL